MTISKMSLLRTSHAVHLKLKQVNFLASKRLSTQVETKNLFFSVSRWNTSRKDVLIENNGQIVKFYVGNSFTLNARKYPYISLDAIQFTLKVGFSLSADLQTGTIDKNRLRVGAVYMCSNLCETEESYGMSDKFRMLSKIAGDNAGIWSGTKIYNGSDRVSNTASSQYRHWFNTNNQFSGQTVWFSMYDAELQPLLLSRPHTVAFDKYGVEKYSCMYKIRIILSSRPF